MNVSFHFVIDIFFGRVVVQLVKRHSIVSYSASSPTMLGAGRSAYMLLITFRKFELLPRQPVISSGLELCSHTGWDLLAMVEMEVFLVLARKLFYFS
jgi:hypothetical protein